MRTQSTANTSRRIFLTAPGAGATYAPFRAVAAATHLRLGGPVFVRTDDPVGIAREHR